MKKLITFFWTVALFSILTIYASGETIYTDSISGSTFTLPGDWVQGQDKYSDIAAYFNLSGKNCRISYSVRDAWEEDVNPQLKMFYDRSDYNNSVYRVEEISEYFNSMISGTNHNFYMKKVGNHNFFYCDTRMPSVIGGSSRNIIAFYVENGYEYVFSLIDYEDSILASLGFDSVLKSFNTGADAISAIDFGKESLSEGIAADDTIPYYKPSYTDDKTTNSYLLNTYFLEFLDLEWYNSTSDDVIHALEENDFKYEITKENGYVEDIEIGEVVDGNFVGTVYEIKTENYTIPVSHIILSFEEYDGRAYFSTAHYITDIPPKRIVEYYQSYYDIQVDDTNAFYSLAGDYFLIFIVDLSGCSMITYQIF